MRGHVDALAVFVDGSDTSFVYVVGGRSGSRIVVDRLTCTKMEVGPVLADVFFPMVRSAVFTSATLAVGDDFGHFRRGIGLDLLPAEDSRDVLLHSPYDYENQMAVYVPIDVPDPRSPGYLDHMAHLLEGVHHAMGGSVLTLFTNRRQMEQLYDRVARPLGGRGLALRVQEGASSVKRLREEFLTDESLSLFATRSFWEGFDARGDTLRCVVIARLPFRFVEDPVLQELKERDRNWFVHHYVPEAALELKQAVGRLIRSSSDEGCVIITDSRLAGKLRYVPTLLQALPVRGVEALQTAEMLEQVEARFGRKTARS